MSGYCSLTPCTDVFQFMLPATSCARAFTAGVTIETLGTSRLIASRSSTVKVFVPLSPVPLRTPPTFCAPALTNSRLVPMLSICACTVACAPWPILTMATTADTPMMMPSMVSAARILLRTNARKATRIMFKRSMIAFVLLPLPLGEGRGEGLRGDQQKEIESSAACPHPTLSQRERVKIILHPHP